MMCEEREGVTVMSSDAAGELRLAGPPSAEDLLAIDLGPNTYYARASLVSVQTPSRFPEADRPETVADGPTRRCHLKGRRGEPTDESTATRRCLGLICWNCSTGNGPDEAVGEAPPFSGGHNGHSSRTWCTATQIVRLRTTVDARFQAAFKQRSPRHSPPRQHFTVVGQLQFPTNGQWMPGPSPP